MLYYKGMEELRRGIWEKNEIRNLEEKEGKGRRFPPEMECNASQEREKQMRSKRGRNQLSISKKGRESKRDFV